MDFSMSNTALSYDSSLNYFLWSEDVISLQKFICEIIPDELQSKDSAEINEDKHHKMFSFKLRDCTVKFYSTTKKIITQGPGSSVLTEKLSQYVEQLAEVTLSDDNEIGEEDNTNGDEDLVLSSGPPLAAEAAVIDDNSEETLCQCQCNFLNLKTELQHVQQDIKKMKKDIKANSKANSKSVMHTNDDEKIKLIEENERLQKELDSLSTANSKLETTIKKLRSDKASLMTALRIFREDSDELKGTETNMQECVINNPKQVSKSGKLSKPKPNSDSSAEFPDHQRKRVVILGDSTVKGLQWWKMSSNKKGPRVNVHSFPGCTVDDMENYMIPTLRKDPDEIILHVGTNDLKAQPNPQRLAEQIVNLADNISQNCASKVTISGLLHRSDDKNLSVKVPKVNKVIKSFASNRGWSFIDHTNIDQNSLNLGDLHLNQQGSASLSRNFLTHIKKSC